MPFPERSKTVARILIAEDDDTVRALLVRALGSDGHDLIETADGTAAFDALNASKGGIDLLLSDVKMPGMDGIELALGNGATSPRHCHHADDRPFGSASARTRPRRACARSDQQAIFARSDHVRGARSAGAAALGRKSRIRNPSADVRYNLAQVAGGSSRQSACEALPGCVAHAERRFRPVP